MPVGFVAKNKQLARITSLVIAQNPWHKVVRKISYLRESSSTDKGEEGVHAGRGNGARIVASDPGPETKARRSL